MNAEMFRVAYPRDERAGACRGPCDGRPTQLAGPHPRNLRARVGHDHEQLHRLVGHAGRGGNDLWPQHQADLRTERQPTEGPWDINFIHSISCSDTAKQRAYDAYGNLGAVPVHSSIVLRTIGSFYAPQAPTQLRTFKEVSTPLADAPALGLFAGVTGGRIEVAGAMYTAPLPAPYGTPGAIDMSFRGEVCY